MRLENGRQRPGLESDYDRKVKGKLQAYRRGCLENAVAVFEDR